MQRKEIGLLMQYHDLEMVNMFPIIPFFFVLEFHILKFICNIYFIVLFV
jgi:hypothetical protein